VRPWDGKNREVYLCRRVSQISLWKNSKSLFCSGESFNGRAKSRLAYQRLTWQGLENVGIHVGLVLMVAYAVCIAAYGIGRPELRQSVAFFT
jgi:hypothetical protein